ncbi:beta-N-acetylhexosaminidase [Nonomuraea sp. NPDC050536]|uniref:beta-N-acetylhexosaminidase n=1 Tax=Nonomuraea sp. NPDC050536 TaxID=3364366 RepID=UPI0037C540A0
MNIIPRPARLTRQPGFWRPTPDGVTLRIERTGLGPEGYRLSVTPDGVLATAEDERGLRWAEQTLRQLEADGQVPCVEIEDAPRFPWRGVMLDVGRWWFPVGFLRRMIDLAALHKLNVVHLHLTDDQGWRMEIERYPRLTEVGAWRAESMLGHHRDQRYDGRPHGGFYTKQELRELVEYGTSRGVTLVPEIDLPGHMRAAIAAYPHLGNHPEAELPVPGEWGVHEQVLNVEEETIRFCQDVLAEVMEVFPSPYVHIGGDECPKQEWRESPRVQQRMRELELPDEDALQSWFVGRMAEFLSAHGRRLVGWDEIVEGGLVPGATVMSWRSEEGGIAAAKAGHDAVMCPSSHTYFDHYQADPDTEPLAIGGLTTLAQVYAYEPVPAGLDAGAAHHILGTQGQVWTEYLPTPEQVEYMAFPRLCALAEVAWGTTGDFAEFEERLARHVPHRLT